MDLLSFPFHRNICRVLSLLQLIRRARDGILGDIPLLLLLLLLLVMVVVVARLRGGNNPKKKQEEKNKTTCKPSA